VIRITIPDFFVARLSLFCFPSPFSDYFQEQLSGFSLLLFVKFCPFPLFSGFLDKSFSRINWGIRSGRFWMNDYYQKTISVST